MSTRLSQRIALLAFALASAAAPALAQGPAPVTEKQSLLTIFVKGIEVPSYFIFAGSLVVIALIIEHFLTVRGVTIAPPDQLRSAKTLIEQRNFRGCLDALKKSQTFFARVMTASMQHGRHGFDAMHEAALEKSGELSGRMFRKVEFLNILGNLGPLLGLLGTVWGMIEAFGSLGSGGGGAGAGELAGGISKALVNTLLGLSLAIVGIGFYGICRNRIESLTVAATVEILDLLEYFRPSGATRSAEGRATASGTATEPAAPAAPAAAPKMVRKAEPAQP